MNREEAVAAIVASGKTPEQAEAYLDILGSAFARRGLVEGEPLPRKVIEERIRTYLGEEGSS